MPRQRPARGRAPGALPPLLPAPVRAEARAGRLPLRSGMPIVIAPGADDADFAAACALRDAVRSACNVHLPVEAHGRTDGLGPHLALRRGEARGRAGDAHRIEIAPERALVEGGGPAGLRYATETLAQLVRRPGRGAPSLPACEIEDAPDFELRGVMLDVSRGKVPTAETLRQLVDLCCRLKLNVLMLYVEHTFRFRRHPEIGADASPLEAETLRELDRYAAERCVDLVPCLQSLGHMEHVLALPRYAHLAETAMGWTVSPQEPGTYELLRDLYDEFLPNFRSPWFNANCDEPWDLERGRSAGRAAELGPGGVYLEHVRRVRDLAREHGKRTMLWGDVVHAHPERIAEIDRDLVLLEWWYEAEGGYDRVKRFAENGLEFLVCPGTSTWNALFPRLENSWLNVARWADAGRRYGARGLLVTDWGDFGHYNLQGNSWLGYAWAAQQAWSGEVPAREFDRAFSRRLFGDASGECARLYRALGAVHGAGFTVFNGSPLQYLFFDDVDEAVFIDASRVAALRRSERRLAAARARLRRARLRFARDPLTWEELLYAADASLFATRKAQAGLAYLAWRRRPAATDARGRGRLAHSLQQLAREQTALGSRLRKLWLARSRPSDLDTTLRRLRRSARSLRAAARALVRNRPPPPPPRRDPPGLAEVRRAVLRSIEDDRG